MSVAQKWVLGGREKFQSAAYSAPCLTQGAPPPPVCCATYHAGDKLRSWSLTIHVLGEGGP